MDNVTTRRPFAAVVNLTAASVVAVTVAASVPPPALVQSTAVPHVAAQSVALAALPGPLQSLWNLASGADPAHPLPTPSNPIAPVAEQFVRNLVSYGGELFAGQGAQIPGQIAAHINNVGPVLLRIPGDLAIDIAYIPFAIGGGAFLGVIAGVGLPILVGSLFPDAESKPIVEFLAPIVLSVAPVVVPILGVAGAAVGAVLGLTVIAPAYWAANALKIRNSLAVALASPVPQPVAGSQPATVAAVTPIDPTPGDTGASATVEAPMIGRSAENRTAELDTTIAVTAAAAEPEPASTLAEPHLDETGPAPDPTSKVTASPVSGKAATRQTHSATHAKSGHVEQSRSHRKAASESAD